MDFTIVGALASFFLIAKQLVVCFGFTIFFGKDCLPVLAILLFLGSVSSRWIGAFKPVWPSGRDYGNTWRHVNSTNEKKEKRRKRKTSIYLSNFDAGNDRRCLKSRRWFLAVVAVGHRSNDGFAINLFTLVSHRTLTLLRCALLRRKVKRKGRCDVRCVQISHCVEYRKNWVAARGRWSHPLQSSPAVRWNSLR